MKGFTLYDPSMCQHAVLRYVHGCDCVMLLLARSYSVVANGTIQLLKLMSIHNSYCIAEHLAQHL